MTGLNGLKTAATANVSTMTVPKHAVFLRAAKGPFECGHCEYFRQSDLHCMYPAEMRKKFKIPDVVAAHDCCDFYEPK